MFGPPPSTQIPIGVQKEVAGVPNSLSAATQTNVPLTEVGQRLVAVAASPAVSSYSYSYEGMPPT